MAYAEQMSRKLLMQGPETHLLTYHPKREVKSTDYDNDNGYHIEKGIRRHEEKDVWEK